MVSRRAYQSLYSTARTRLRLVSDGMVTTTAEAESEGAGVVSACAMSIETMRGTSIISRHAVTTHATTREWRRTTALKLDDRRRPLRGIVVLLIELIELDRHV